VFGPTVAFYYSSASTYAGVPDVAWVMYFGDGFVTGGYKFADFSVRAVRSGL
jgi:hypothetical protein